MDGHSVSTSEAMFYINFGTGTSSRDSAGMTAEGFANAVLQAIGPAGFAPAGVSTIRINVSGVEGAPGKQTMEWQWITGVQDIHGVTQPSVFGPVPTAYAGTASMAGSILTLASSVQPRALQNLVPNLTDLIKINHAFGDASGGLTQVKGKKDPCHDFFMQGRSPKEVEAIFSSFWKSAFHDERVAATAATANSGQGIAATLRLGNAFFADDNSVPGTGLSFSFANNMYLSDAYQLTPRQNRALTILHEFAHALGLIPSDNSKVDPSGTQSAKNDATIYEKCKNIINSLPLKDE